MPGSVYRINTNRVKRGKTTKAEVVNAICVLKNAVDCFLNSVHVMYLDACHVADKWVILLCCFMDSNHSVQPIGFSLCQAETKTDWEQFLLALDAAGMKKVTDLVVYSDRNDALVNSVRLVFPSCEWVPCAVHLQRSVQLLWEESYGRLSMKNEKNVVVFNKFMEMFKKACLSTEKRECEKWLREMKQLEEAKCGYHFCWKYLTDINEVFMYHWRYNHMMMRSSNPVESCMSVLKRNLTGKGSPRDETFFNRYRMLIEWVFYCIEKRHNSLSMGKIAVPVCPYKTDDIPTPWIVKEVMKRCHYTFCYESTLTVEPYHNMRNRATEGWKGLFSLPL